MTELLKRWHEHEPSRCLIGPPSRCLIGPPTSHLCASVVLGRADFLVQFDRPTPAQIAVLFAAVIEAIEARGWDCRLTSNAPQLGAWHAIVWTGQTRPGARTYRPSHDGQTETPAAALLAAYVAALEAEGDQ